MKRILRNMLPVFLIALHAGGASAQDLFAPRAIGVDKLVGIVALAVPGLRAACAGDLRLVCVATRPGWPQSRWPGDDEPQVMMNPR